MGNIKSKTKGKNDCVVEETIESKQVKSEQSTPGMIKAKEYDWKDSNLALFGSDTEKSVKKNFC